MITFIKKLFSKKEIRFLFVGGLNTIVGYGSYALLLFFGTQYLIANIFSTIIGAIHSYIWNKFFTFKSPKKSLTEVIRFFSVYAISFVFGLLTLYIMGNVIGIDPYIAGLINIIFTTLISWFGHNFFSFKQE